ncbi:MAG: hypothetical protein ACPLYX_03000 [Rectinema subterraneum]|uniref:hypothetical protein n=1 Tax=Rectinema subterraneum TaxID=2653714 RepID=UPI003C7B80DA
MRKVVLFVGLTALLVLAGCELFPNVNLTWDDIKGEWDFPDTTFNNSLITAIHLSLLGPFEGEQQYHIDLSWNNFSNFYYGGGSIDKNVFTGTYSVRGDTSDPPVEYAITVTFSLDTSKLKAVFSGQGPLNGLILEHGTKGVL